MPFVPLTQPLGKLDVGQVLERNLQHPLDDGLVINWHGGAEPLVNMVDPSAAKRFTLNSLMPAKRATLAGLGSDFPGASSREIVMGTDTNLNSSDPFTIAVQFVFDGYGVEANPGLFSLKTDSTAFGAFFFTSASYQDLTFGSSATWLPQKTGAGTVTVGEVTNLVIGFDGVNSLAGSSYSCWINDNEISLANAGAVSAPTAANHFGEFNAGLDFDGAGLGFRLWNKRLLPPIALRELSAHYWDPFGEKLEIPPWPLQYFVPEVAPPGGAKNYYLGGNAMNRGQRGIGWAA